jgi:transposase InsO family protein
MADVLDVSPSGFYAWRKRPPSERARADARRLLNIRVVQAESGGTYGAPRVQRELQDGGIRVGTERVARLMRDEGLQGRGPRRRRVATTDSRHDHPIAPNRLDRQFDVRGIRVNPAWVSDITYIPTQEGWLYLAAVLDLASRRCIGWAMRPTLDAELAVSALTMAITTRRPPAGLVHHSDRGSQYACAEYRAVLDAHGIVPSMSRKGNCWDNAVAESFFATLELELIDRHRWATRDAARRDIFRFIETWYNRKRRHSTLDYVSPVAYEEQLQNGSVWASRRLGAGGCRRRRQRGCRRCRRQPADHPRMA